MKLEIPDKELARIDAAIERALDTGSVGGLQILGYGEVSCVVASDTEAGRFAVKRLPPFKTRSQLDRYEATLAKYTERLSTKGVSTVPSDLRSIPRDDGSLVAYCIQPMADPATLGPRYFVAHREEEASSAFTLLLNHILETVDSSTGLDAQISNWSIEDGKARYFDVTTPMLRDPEGKEELDIDLFLASLPAPLRPVVKRFMLKSILDKYYDRRGVVLDLLGNLLKERLSHLIQPFLAIANERIDRPITEEEIQAYYKDDAGTWALLQRLRGIDRFVQKNVLRRRYPFLLPGKIER